MAKKNKDRYLPKDLEGFEEVLDLVNGPIKSQSGAKGVVGKNVKQTNFALLNFLEFEAIRLERLSKALELKKSTGEQLSATDNLIQRQTKNLEIQFAKLLDIMKDENSNFFENNSTLFQKIKLFFR